MGPRGGASGSGHPVRSSGRRPKHRRFMQPRIGAPQHHPGAGGGRESTREQAAKQSRSAPANRRPWSRRRSDREIMAIHDIARRACECARTWLTFGVMGAAAALSLSLIAAPARAASQVAPVAGNACFEPAPAPASPLDDAAHASARLDVSIQAHRSYFRTCPVTRLAAGSPRSSTEAMRRGIAPGRRFRDCAQCPELVAVPAGSFMMGSNEFGDEGPVHRVTIVEAFAVGVYETTFAEWDACRRAGGCAHHPNDGGWGRETRPVVNVSWEDAQQYVRWLSRKTGERYRLPSESEWEYAARAGTTTRYWWGDSRGGGRANCRGCWRGWDDDGTTPVGSFIANAFGLHDVHGNVWEWVEDCWHGSYAKAPGDGSAWTRGGECGRRVLRGGSWSYSLRGVRAAVRLGVSSGIRNDDVGFRVARVMD